LEEAIKFRFNISLEITLRLYEPIINTITRFTNDNYRCELNILAVNKSFSLLGIHQRYENQKAATGFGRWTSPQAHDNSYNNMINTINQI
jgi:hypothetical protein